MPTPPANLVRRWMHAASPAERAKLARLAKTTAGQLKWLAGGYRSDGKASVSAELAIKLEHASVILNAANPELPVLLREQLARACGKCEFAKACRA